jgi:hemoglobin
MSKDPTIFDRIGGDALRAVIVDFYDRVFDDIIIGFLFAGKDRSRLVEMEWQFTAKFLGADLPYRGRSMPEAHKRVPILGGHFERRLQILRNTMADHHVDPEVQQSWIDHQLAMRALVTGDKGSECDHDLATARTVVDAASPAAPPSSGLVKLGRR